MTTVTQATPIGFIGLGVMGKSMVHNLIKVGFSVTLHNRSRGPVDELVQEGAHAAGSPAEVASMSEIIGLCLPDTPDVGKVLFGENGVAARRRLQ